MGLLKWEKSNLQDAFNLSEVDRLQSARYSPLYGLQKWRHIDIYLGGK
jgi:hypothetical protein